MTTLVSHWHGPNAANWASLAPGDSKPSEINVTVHLGDSGTYSGNILVLYYGVNKKTGVTNRRRTTQRWRFTADNLHLFREDDVRALLRGRTCR